jgi:hypothetical protein
VELMTRRRMRSARVSEEPNWVPRRWRIRYTGVGNGAKFDFLTLAYPLRQRSRNPGVRNGEKSLIMKVCLLEMKRFYY